MKNTLDLSFFSLLSKEMSIIMIPKRTFESLKRRFANYSSWAIWSPPYNNVRINCDDLSRLENDEIHNILHNNFVFVGLNASEGHDVEPQKWSQFHSADSKRSWDFRMREATYQTPFEGSYMTDFCKGINMTNSNDFMNYLNKNKEIELKSAETLREELNILGGTPTLFAMGRNVETLLIRNGFSENYRIFYIPHYSNRGTTGRTIHNCLLNALGN